MNILFTCAGRRNYLLQAFRAADPEGRIVAADADQFAPALQEADNGVVVPPVSDAAYLTALEDVCSRFSIQLLIPLNDLELPIIAGARERFAARGVRVAVSSADVVTTCFDKLASVRWLESCGMRVPRTFASIEATQTALESTDLAFPLIVKPRWGTASLGIEVTRDRHELLSAYDWVQRRIQGSIIAEVSACDTSHSVVIQELIEAPEFGLDVVNDFDGNFAGAFARRKLSMRSGETDRAISVVDPQLSQLGELLGRSLRHGVEIDTVQSELFEAEVAEPHRRTASTSLSE